MIKMDDLEQQLLTRARQWDTQALTEIFDQYSPGIYRFAMRRTGSSQQAEDCVSETFQRFLLALQKNRLHINTSLKAYLYRIAHNWIIDQYRHQPQLSQELDENLANPQEIRVEITAAESIQKNALRDAIALLPPQQQLVISLRFLEDWSLEETSTATGKSIGAVKLLQNRGIKQLRQWLATTEDEI